jgi:hypothetical protein
MYACFDPEQPNGSGCAAIIPTTLAPSVQDRWSYLGYAKAMLQSSNLPLLIISAYKSHSNSNNPLNKDKDMAIFLAVHIAKARRSQWRTIIGRDLNLYPEDRDLSSETQSATRWWDTHYRAC